MGDDVWRGQTDGSVAMKRSGLGSKRTGYREGLEVNRTAFEENRELCRTLNKDEELPKGITKRKEGPLKMLHGTKRLRISKTEHCPRGAIVQKI